MVAATLVTIAVFGGVPARGDVAVTPHQEAINQAITDGLEWLANNQRPDGGACTINGRTGHAFVTRAIGNTQGGHRDCRDTAIDVGETVAGGGATVHQ